MYLLSFLIDFIASVMKKSKSLIAVLTLKNELLLLNSSCILIRVLEYCFISLAAAYEQHGTSLGFGTEYLSFYFDS